MNALLVLCTCPDEANARSLAASLVREHLAACVGVLPPMMSVYRWEGQMTQTEEVQLLIKTTPDRFEELRDQILRTHPYRLPEVLAFEAVAGLDRYLDWIQTETRRDGT